MFRFLFLVTEREDLYICGIVGSRLSIIVRFDTYDMLEVEIWSSADRFSV